MTRVRNDLFDPRLGLDRGRPFVIELLWYACKVSFFQSSLPWPSAMKCFLLRCFGSEVGRGVVIKPRVNIHLPWKLVVGDHVWVGEEVFVLNFARVTIGRQACISQRVFLCTGNHDYRDPAMPYRNRPITIGEGAWIGAQCFVAPGVTVGDEAVVTAGSIVSKDQPMGMICAGNPCVPLKPRWRSEI